MSVFRIIRDEDGDLSPDLLALMIDWGIDPDRCAVEGCNERPNTIVSAGPLFAVCEAHYQQGNKPGGRSYRLRRMEATL